MQISQCITVSAPGAAPPLQRPRASRARSLLRQVLAVAALVAGCSHPATQPSQVDTADWQARYEAAKKCEAIESQTLLALNQSLQQIRSDLFQTHQQLPGRIHEQVQAPLSTSFAAVTTRLDQIDRKTAHLADQLTALDHTEREARDDLARKLEDVGSQGQNSPAKLAASLTQVLDELRDFNQNQINGGLRLENHSKAAILEFHKKIYDRLRELVIQLKTHAK